jgi:hypothetical protein
MTDIPILFQPEMIEAIDGGRKTMTRRLAWGEPRPVGTTVTRAEREEIQAEGWKLERRGTHWYAQKSSPWQKVKAGDRLWVREQHWRWGVWERDWLGSWSFHPEAATMGNIFYGKKPGGTIGTREMRSTAWHKRPSIFMPKEHSRFTLIVTATKIEPLQDISESDARAEGAPWYVYGHGVISDDEYRMEPGYQPNKRMGFCQLWNDIHGWGPPSAWDKNPEVVAVSFRIISANIDSEQARAA